jgi:hypothetical protein
MHRGVDRSVHGHQIVGADELVQLDVVDVAALPVLGGVQDNEQVIGVRVDLGHAVAFDAVAYGESVEAEHIGQNPDGVAVTARDVNPDHGVGPRQ